MNKESMDEQIAEIIQEAIGQISHLRCNHSESQCNKDDPDYEPKHIHCGTDRCKGLHKFMNRVFVELTPYIKHINYDTKNLNSKEARQLNLHNRCVVVDGEIKFSSSLVLKKELPKLLKAKGLI